MLRWHRTPHNGPVIEIIVQISGFTQLCFFSWSYVYFSLNMDKYICIAQYNDKKICTFVMLLKFYHVIQILNHIN